MILPRQSDIIFEGDGTRRVIICDKTCETAYIIKWSILLAIFGLFFTWLLVGYWHVRMRARQGLPPLGYHRWLAPKRQPVPQNCYTYYQNQPGANPHSHAYGMQNFVEPPPVYSGDMPPTYQPPPNGPGVYPPPAGATKISPQQNGAV
ncbi:hypothetical protein EG328_009176 [Venturia inaequalis]|uniref:Uncharacterized protein n=1 Tax=Venturia inaequalis TaxID=5025 RepID=A0A8H3U989_VENIN|nr:hypothetical protein EG327_000265 [Venturia inaequalis]KAE9966107.1 hypothetical protein EG328_009176 [Venturia inaequalis]RDI80309.1 hypothetical protein Vi05172_g9686 [Venturia inaequalis]